jgi:transposase
MKQVQKTYPAECKREAVRLAQTSGKPSAHRARELGISDTSIHEWCKQLAAPGLLFTCKMSHFSLVLYQAQV